MNHSNSVLLTVLVFTTFLAAAPHAGWITQASGSAENLNGVSFVSTSTGTAVGNGGMILHTSDAGANWLVQAAGLSADLSELYLTTRSPCLINSVSR